VLGNWSNAVVTSSAGANKTIETKTGASSTQISPLTTLTGYRGYGGQRKPGPDAPNDLVMAGSRQGYHF
jgi:hypothetical protein